MKEHEKRVRPFDLVRQLIKLLNIGITIILVLWSSPQRFGKRRGRSENQSSRKFKEEKENARFGLVWFYNTSTTVGHLISNLLHTCISDINNLIWFSLMSCKPL